MDNVIPINQNLIPEGYARLNVTYQGNNGDLPDPILFDLSDAEIRRVAAESIATGTIPGIPAARADFADFVVDRFAATADVPVARVMLRPKTPFGFASVTTPKNRIPKGVWFLLSAFILAVLGGYVFDGKEQLANFTFSFAGLMVGFGIAQMNH